MNSIFRPNEIWEKSYTGFLVHCGYGLKRKVESCTLFRNTREKLGLYLGSINLETKLLMTIITKYEENIFNVEIINKLNIYNYGKIN